MAVDLRIVGGREGGWLRGRLRKVLALMGVRGGEWTISVVGDREMAGLHRRTMGVGGTTDVLTFDLREGGRKTRNTKHETRNGREGRDVELDTVVCVDEARRRAGEMGHPVRVELLLYCVHSLLHVQGYDDVTAGGAKVMHAREDALLVAIGVGAVYASKLEDGSRKTEVGSLKRKLPR